MSRVQLTLEAAKKAAFVILLRAHHYSNVLFTVATNSSLNSVLDFFVRLECLVLGRSVLSCLDNAHCSRSLFFVQKFNFHFRENCGFFG